MKESRSGAEGNEPRSGDQLDLYIAYAHPLSAKELGNILTALDRMHDHILTSAVRGRWPGFDEGDAERWPLAVVECSTPRSISIVFTVGGGAALAALIVRLLVVGAKSLAEARKTWYEGTKTKHEARKVKALAVSSGGGGESFRKDRSGGAAPHRPRGAMGR